mmetsp:Transcript_10144/g.22316  ORF Transcript_10144/g.22316 Transcript_10144/m.22316 type:complete len:106 (-) Transcript_10144:770-1087(-)
MPLLQTYYYLPPKQKDYTTRGLVSQEEPQEAGVVIAAYFVVCLVVLALILFCVRHYCAEARNDTSSPLPQFNTSSRKISPDGPQEKELAKVEEEEEAKEAERSES